MNPAHGPARIALLSHGLDRGGGVPGVARWLLDGLRGAGHPVDLYDLAVSRADETSRRLLAPGSWSRRSLRDSRSAPLPHEHWGGNAVELEIMRYRPRRELTRALRGYDLIQVVAGAPAWAAPALPAGRPVVLQVASTVRWERATPTAAAPGPARALRQGMTALTSRLERRVLRRVAAVLAENRPMFEHVRRHGQPRVRLAPPGIDVDVFTPHPAGWRARGPLLSVCRLNDPRKGLERMIRGYAQLRRLVGADRCPPLVLAGRDRPAQTVLRLIDRFGLTETVLIRSDVPPAALPALYRDASVFLQTSYEEGLGLAVLEAMASGLPVVSTDSAGSRQLVRTGSTGWLVPQHPEADVPGLVADRAAQLLTGRGGEFGAQGRAFCVEHYSTKRTLDRFLETYDEVLTAGAGGPTGSARWHRPRANGGEAT
ncbi:glycosyltransferase family 4 protein [Plantactinospora sp. KBS50]|uniref:glycosyltransferase family 4 protein n=1 Tax=Plantactinospora sp. KBS50 TaxID=2024580 RepID=UPI000BAAF468|nr:glycosyltransferase family 4 protein [Plantactinospora sp. KBS50]ASW54498.1 hypothetical protein CIK06_10335 [Plantactinospora sp. KBS50]